MSRPFLLGATMAAMMLWMGHERIMAGEITLSFGAFLFLLAHAVPVIAVLLLTMMFPRVRDALRQHRPSLRHMSIMLAGMLVSAGSIHLIVHGALL